MPQDMPVKIFCKISLLISSHAYAILKFLIYDTIYPFCLQYSAAAPTMRVHFQCFQKTISNICVTDTYRQISFYHQSLL